MTSPPSTVHRLHLTLAIGLFGSLLCTHRLWMGNRDFPLVPLLQHPFFMQHSCDTVVFGALLLLVFLSLWLRIAGVCAPGFVLMGVYLCLQDGARLHPWFYQQLLMYSALAVFYCSKPTSDNVRKVSSSLQLIVVGLYFWSGVFKMNSAFWLGVYPHLTEPLVDAMPSLSPFLTVLGWCAPFLEAIGAISLLFPRVQRAGVVGLVLMHCFILIGIGPFGLNYNSSVWPWNGMMCLLLWQLFWNTDSDAKEIFSLRHGPLHVFLLVASVGLPALGTIGLWDRYLSFSLYSGRLPEGYISFRANEATKLPRSLLAGARFNHEDERYRVVLNDWSYQTLNTPLTPSPTVITRVASEVCRGASIIDDLLFGLSVPEGLWSPRRKVEVYRCVDGDLLSVEH